MKKLHFLSISATALLTLPSSIQAEKQKPNVVFILIDDMGWKDLGCYGSDFYQTPNIDQFAGNAVKFNNGYAACTVSSPTRASIMTGKYPAKLHLTDWIKGDNPQNRKMKAPDWIMYLDHQETTMAEVLKANGYATAHIGKWHLGEDEKYWPEHQGFDLNIGGWRRGQPVLNPRINSYGYFSPYGNPRLENGEDGEYLTERLANEACNYIQNNQSTPFFLNLWFYNVHTPLQAKANKVEKYKALVDDTKLQKNPTYAAMVEHVDEAVGKVIAQLKKTGIYENTIIVFTSDNGGLLLGEKNRVTNNAPLRLGKGHVYEGGVRVPFLIKNAGKNHLAKTCDVPVISIDFMPTILDLTESKTDKTVRAGFDGLSLKKLINSKKNKLNRKAIFWHYPHYHSEGATPYSAIRLGDWKLINLLEDNSFELYDLKNDISECINLANQNPKMLAKLKKKLLAWRINVDAQMPVLKQR
jgi:arylsulfatase A-like enzyme